MDNNLELFQQGLQDYVGAMMAIKEFRREVFKKSAKVLCSNLMALGTALGLGLNPDRISIHENPDNPSASTMNGTWSWVGAQIPVKPWRGAYFGLFWNQIQGTITPHVAAMFSAPNKATMNAANRAFREKGFADIDCSEFSEMKMFETLPGGDPARYEYVLNSLIQKWIEAWGEVGGLNAIPRR